MSEFSSLSGVALLSAVFAASLLGSLHCVGMCGPFVAVYSAAGAAGDEKGSLVPAHLAYHLGRALTYTTLGALGGALGVAVDFAGEASGWVHVATLVSGVLVIVWGLGLLFPRLRLHSPLERFFGRTLITLGRKPRVFRASLLGVFTPMLPCGWLYAFVVTAVGTGSVIGGAALMAVFWLGTVPALWGMGAVLGRIGHSVRERVPVLTGIALICIGLLAISSRLSHAAPGVSGQSGGNGSSGEVKPCH